MDRLDHKKLVPPSPLKPFYIQEGETDAFGKPLEVGAERFKHWGMFGYDGACADLALSQDSVPAIKWCIEHGLVNAQCVTLMGSTLRGLAKERGHVKVEKHLASLGWPL